PGTPQVVPDRGDRAQLEQRGRATLRVCVPLCDAWLPAQAAAHRQFRSLARQNSVDIEEGGEPADIDSVLDFLACAPEAQPWLRETARRLRADPRRRIEPHPAGGLVMRSSRRASYSKAAAAGVPSNRVQSAEPDFTSQDEASSFVSRPISLRCHSEGVAVLVRKFADACGLPAEIVGDLELAGKLHDVGKADPRFQRW